MNTLRLIFFTLAITMTTHFAHALDSNTIAQIDSVFAVFNQTNAPGASVMIVHSGRIAFSKSYGLADLGSKACITTNTNFRLASVSKQFTAMCVLILAERKRLSLDEPLTAFFPEFPAFGKQITVRQLLTHTSGLPDYEDLIPKDTTIPVLDQDVLRLLLAQDKTLFAPGSQYRYSNTGYALLALIVEARSDMKFSRFLQENIFKPLKMSDTLAYEQGASVVANRAFGHTLKSNEWQRTDQSLTSSVLGDGGIYSSTADLVKWDAALLGKKLVSAATLRQAFTPHTPTDKPGRSYGFGWYLMEHRGLKVIYHSGESIGFRTRLVRIPEKDFCLIILANRSDAKLEDYATRAIDLALFREPR